MKLHLDSEKKIIGLQVFVAVVDYDTKVHVIHFMEGSKLQCTYSLLNIDVVAVTLKFES